MLFECVYGGAIGASIPLVVTCASSFAGLTITCTDGTKTLTKTCSSTSPYEVEFMLPNTGTWTISGTISGTTYTESVLVENFDVELTTNLHLTVDVYSAANDTISYTGIDNQTHTITTDSNGHATATITINGNGSTFTFTSSVAKKPTNLSSYYSKSISLTSSTSSIYVMPDKAVYWYGNKVNCETANTANGWSYSSPYSWRTPTYNTNSVSLNLTSSGSSRVVGIGAKNSINTKTLKMIAQGKRTADYTQFIGVFNGRSAKDTTGSSYVTQGWSPDNFTSTSLATFTSNVSNNVNTYPLIHTLDGGNLDVYAIWGE